MGLQAWVPLRWGAYGLRPWTGRTHSWRVPPYTLTIPVGKEPGLFDLVIINDNLDEAYAQLKLALSEVDYSGLLVLCGVPFICPALISPGSLTHCFPPWQEIKKAQGPGQA